MDPLEAELKTGLIEASSLLSPKAGDDNSTHAIFSKLVELGHTHRMQVRCSTTGWKGDLGEWLWDVTWIQLVNNDVTHIELIAECEWSRDWPNIQEDFEKLVVGRSAHRLMIFRAESMSLAEEYLDEMVRLAKANHCTQSSDRYLLACWEYGSGGHFVIRNFQIGR